MNSFASSASWLVVRIVFAGELPEQRLRPIAGRRRVRPDDLGQRVQLLEGVALGDPLRAERDVDPAAAVGEGRCATYSVVPG